jgi:hypothetical protein
MTHTSLGGFMVASFMIILDDELENMWMDLSLNYIKYIPKCV